jgi:hypothetical protein
MNLGKMLVSVTAGIALVASAGLATSVPAQAKTKTKGVTVISFDKSLAPIIAGIVVVPPAKKSGTRLSFPVTKAQGPTVSHSGAIKIGTTEVSDPVITIGQNNTASVTVTSALGAVELFTIKNFKMRTSKGKQQIWQGFLHLTANPIVVDILNASVGAQVFTADMGLGQIRTTINKK